MSEWVNQRLHNYVRMGESANGRLLKQRFLTNEMNTLCQHTFHFLQVLSLWKVNPFSIFEIQHVQRIYQMGTCIIYIEVYSQTTNEMSLTEISE